MNLDSAIKKLRDDANASAAGAVAPEHMVADPSRDHLDETLAALSRAADPSPQPSPQRGEGDKAVPGADTGGFKPLRPIEQVGSATRAKLDALRPRLRRLDSAHADTMKLFEQHCFAETQMLRRHREEIADVAAEGKQISGDLQRLQRERQAVFAEIQQLEADEKFGGLGE